MSENVEGKCQAWELLAYKTEIKKSEVNIPELKSSNDVLVKVLASSVNPLDIEMLNGYGNVFLNALRKFDNLFSRESQAEFPIILGRDFVGTVQAKGKSVRNEINVGDIVMGVSKPHKQGAHAEYVVVSDSLLVKKPDNIEVEKAAGLLYAGLTAWSALKISGGLFVRPSSNKRALVLGGSGGVGSSAVQLLKAWDAFVVATCSTSAVSLCERLKADIVVDYTQPNAMEQIAKNAPYDIILDAAGISSDKYKDYIPYLRSFTFAKFITLRPPVLPNTDQYGFIMGNLKNLFDLAYVNATPAIFSTGTIRWGFFMPFSFAIKELAELASSEKITTVVDSVYKFSDTPKAYEKVRGGHLRGKVIITMDNSQL